jgi:hypothetical protein
VPEQTAPRSFACQKQPLTRSDVYFAGNLRRNLEVDTTFFPRVTVTWPCDCGPAGGVRCPSWISPFWQKASLASGVAPISPAMPQSSATVA